MEQNQEVKKPAEFKLQRVEKESWEHDESGLEEKIKQKRKSRSPQLRRRKVSSVVSVNRKTERKDRNREKKCGTK